PRVGLLLGLTDPVCGLNMGETAELLAREFSVTREDQDAFALQSNQRAVAARDRLADEICPTFLTNGAIKQISSPSPREERTGRGPGRGASSNGAVTSDNAPRDNQSLE